MSQAPMSQPAMSQPVMSAELPVGSLSRASDLLGRSGVRAIVLVHGTFAGNDVAGLVREIARFSPVSARRLRSLSKRWLDEYVGDVGNYSAAYAEDLSQLINSGSIPIPVHRFHWSGENHHLGRADGVMSLIEFIDALPKSGEGDGRLLMFAHSHGGNVLAMLSSDRRF